MLLSQGLLDERRLNIWYVKRVCRLIKIKEIKFDMSSHSPITECFKANWLNTYLLLTLSIPKELIGGKIFWVDLYS